MPSMTKVDIGVDTLKKASEIDGIIGFKDSSGNMIRFHEYIQIMKDDPEFSLLIGPEELMAEVVLFGGYGGLTAARILIRNYLLIFTTQQLKKTFRKFFVYKTKFSS